MNGAVGALGREQKVIVNEPISKDFMVGFELELWPLFLALLNVLVYISRGKGYLSGERKGKLMWQMLWSYYK